MASSESDQVTDEDAARQAAEVAVELTEAEGPEDRRRLMGALNNVARSAGRAVGRGAGIAKSGTGGAARRSGDMAKRSAEAARRGSGGARQRAQTAGRGATSFVNWLSAQVIAMGPRLRIRDQATLRAQFPGRSDDEIADLLVDHAARAAGAVGAATGAWGACRCCRRGRPR